MRTLLTSFFYAIAGYLLIITAIRILPTLMSWLRSSYNTMAKVEDDWLVWNPETQQWEKQSDKP